MYNAQTLEALIHRTAEMAADLGVEISFQSDSKGQSVTITARPYSVEASMSSEFAGPNTGPLAEGFSEPDYTLNSQEEGKGKNFTDETDV